MILLPAFEGERVESKFLYHSTAVLMVEAFPQGMVSEQYFDVAGSALGTLTSWTVS